jgi:hypothetical protein
VNFLAFLSSDQPPRASAVIMLFFAALGHMVALVVDQ